MEQGSRPRPDTVDDYISAFPPEVQRRMKELRRTILGIAPEAEECISYGMPAYKTNGHPLIYFAGFKNHIGLYPTPTGVESFKEDLSRYKQGKGSVQFPLDEPLPLELVKKIVIFKREENSKLASK